MKIVVDIPDELYAMYKVSAENGITHKAIQYILDGKPLAEKTGHWKPTVVRGSESYICSECSAECCYVTTNFCPSCGAKMIDPQESEG